MICFDINTGSLNFTSHVNKISKLVRGLRIEELYDFYHMIEYFHIKLDVYFYIQLLKSFPKNINHELTRYIKDFPVQYNSSILQIWCSKRQLWSGQEFVFYRICQPLQRKALSDAIVLTHTVYYEKHFLRSYLFFENG